MVLEAELHLIPKPAADALVLVGYRDVYEAAEDVPDDHGAASPSGWRRSTSG